MISYTRRWGAFGAAYAALSVYFNVLPLLWPMPDALRVVHMLLVFPLASLITRTLWNQGLAGCGLRFFRGWWKHLAAGLALGVTVWLLMYGVRFVTQGYVWLGIKPWGESLLVFSIILIGFGLGSLINDLIVRGLLFACFHQRLPIFVLMPLSILLYAVDDIWYGGLTLQNFIFSVVLGLSLTYAFYRTGAIWANTGIHMGLNVVYGLLFGISGKPGDGVVWFEVASAPLEWHLWLSTAAAGVLFLISVPIVNRLKH